MYNNRQVIYESVEPCTPPEYSFIRGFHALPDFPPVDVYLNGMLRAINFKYKDMTPYMPSGFESYNVQFFKTGTKEKPLLDIKNLKTPRGQIVTFAVLGKLSDIKLLPIIDDINETISPDETKIRFYNLDSSPITFNMSLPSGAVSRSLSPGHGTDYNKINPGEHRFEIRLSNLSTKPINIRINLKPGKIYTLYITGSVDPNSPFYAQGNIPQIILAADGNTILSKCNFLYN
jgi:hypothetical protein